MKTEILVLCFTLFFIVNGFGQVSDTAIYKVLDVYPEFRYETEESTVNNSLERYFRENFHMPLILIDNGYHGRIDVQFIVEKSGLVSQVEIYQGMGDDLDKAVLECVKNMPNWVAGEKGGKTVRSHMIIPISVKWLYGGVIETNLKNQYNKNIYQIALEKHLDYLKDFNQKRPDLIRIPEVYYIEEDGYSTANFPSEINGQKIELLSRKNIIEKVKGRKSLSILSVRPIRWHNDRMEIHVIEFSVNGNSRNLNFVNMSNGSVFVVKNNINCDGFEIERITR